MLTSGEPGAGGNARSLLAKVSPVRGLPACHLLTIVKVGQGIGCYQAATAGSDLGQYHAVSGWTDTEYRASGIPPAETWRYARDRSITHGFAPQRNCSDGKILMAGIPRIRV